MSTDNRTTDIVSSSGSYNVTSRDLYDVGITNEQPSTEKQSRSETQKKVSPVSTLQDIIAAADFYKRFNPAIIPTFSLGLDDMLYGGIKARSITEFYGPPNSGKTQLCHSLSVSALVEGQKMIDCTVLYVDTEHTFNPCRIFEIAARGRIDIDHVLANVHVLEVDSVAEQENILNLIPGHLQSKKVRLVIIDSIIRNYKAEFVGRSRLAERQQRLFKFVHGLSTLAFAQNIAIVIINHVSDKPVPCGGYRPAGGRALGYAITHRILLEPIGQEILAKLIKSAHYPSTQCRLVISEKGVTDAPEYY